ncbi:hypothetical protein BDN67DRAFT_969624 [Paxillus ammoniavirescens]|nr:hypothetical protein BDN67DRAFT_969624 [Paxillus ammoniavirescens]
MPRKRQRTLLMVKDQCETICKRRPQMIRRNSSRCHKEADKAEMKWNQTDSNFRSRGGTYVVIKEFNVFPPRGRTSGDGNMNGFRWSLHHGYDSHRVQEKSLVSTCAWRQTLKTKTEPSSNVREPGSGLLSRFSERTMSESSISCDNLQAEGALHNIPMVSYVTGRTT